MEKPNNNALAQSLVWAGIAYVVLLIVVIPRTEDYTGAYMAGRMLVPAAVAWGVTWAVAHNSSKKWRWWIYPLVVPAVAAVIALMLSAEDLSDRASGRAADGGARADSGPLLPELVAPSTQGGWTRIDDPAAREQVARAEQGAAQFGSDIDSVTAGYYSHKDPRALGFFIGINGNYAKGASVESTLRNAMAGARIDDYDTFDPGDAGGALGCGQGQAQGQQYLACMWIGNERTVVMRWDSASLDADVAAQLTTELRDLATAGQ